MKLNNSKYSFSKVCQISGNLLKGLIIIRLNKFDKNRNLYD